MSASLFALFFTFLPPANGAKVANPHLAELREMGVSPNRADIVKYLDGLHPTPERQRRMAELVGQLGHADYRRREAAMRTLRQLPVPPIAALTRAAKSKDPEIAWRAKRVLRTTSSNRERTLFAVLRTIEIKKIAGTAASVLRTIPFCSSRHIREAARVALRATSRREDLPLLRTSLADPDAQVRRAATVAVAALLGKEAKPELLARLKDADDGVRMESAVGLANLGDRASLPVLSTLLESKSLFVRIQAAGVLRQFTGQRFAFTAYAQPADRKPAVKKWRDWLTANAATAKLRFPLRTAGRMETGRTLVTLYSAGRVVEFDADGKTTLTITGGYSGPWGGSRLSNGNILINYYSSGAVVEYDPTGKKVVWKKTGLRSPWCARHLPNGNILVATSPGLQEIDRAGKIVWNKPITGGAADVRTLPSGNLLITQTRGYVLEMTRDGKTVWQLSGLKTPYRADRLPNGNTLVAENGRGRVVEFDPSKKEVWSRDGFANPNTVQRLSNGNTLIGDAKGVHEVSPDGKIVSTKALGTSLARRY